MGDKKIKRLTFLLLIMVLMAILCPVLSDPDFYNVLGVHRLASTNEIKKAFRMKAKEVHPDKNAHPQAIQQFFDLKMAYDTLSKIERRKKYDSVCGNCGKSWLEYLKTTVGKTVGRPLQKLKDFFRNSSDYFRSLSEFCKGELKTIVGRLNRIQTNTVITMTTTPSRKRLSSGDCCWPEFVVTEIGIGHFQINTKLVCRKLENCNG